MNITKEQLIAAIHEATRTEKVKVPSSDFYAHPGDSDSDTDTITYVCPRTLIEALEAL